MIISKHEEYPFHLLAIHQDVNDSICQLEITLNIFADRLAEKEKQEQYPDIYFEYQKDKFFLALKHLKDARDVLATLELV